jgi:hypothetical protein
MMQNIQFIHVFCELIGMFYFTFRIIICVLTELDYISSENAIEATRSSQNIRLLDSAESTQPLQGQSLLTLLMEPEDSASNPLQDSIQIIVCPRKKTISVRDFGIGMTKEGLEHAVTIGWPKTNDLSSGQCTNKASDCVAVRSQSHLIF